MLERLFQDVNPGVARILDAALDGPQQRGSAVRIARVHIHTRIEQGLGT